ncbi:MAG TPA: cysteine desulfurase family protein [Treponemataceae bacterium]|jgi:cysteine desulfurase|nr:MAG: Cysteine desulfurase [Spirochaetes bacterium ADurb.Bin215]HOF84380.1 cysteine desulfurase family protein [Treponemataceae bacterium]HOS34805.1 cysteine desulfurase family protein [Treponemataceae bacterium]HOU37585.1 cysteine desulfurase family protein [Treponemataceae bacterium]HPL91246.1 cysteine desulfurase family protein [Treponemataceae bacterium]
MNKRIYLDYNATTPVDSRVQNIFIRELNNFANASSMHEDGRTVAAALNEARKRVATLINVDAEQILFTSGGSESNNTIFRTMASPAMEATTSRKERFSGRKRILVSAIEHPCVMESAKYLATLGMDVHFIPVDADGRVDEDRYRELLFEGEKTGRRDLMPLLVSIMMANNEIGTIQDISRLSALAHEAGSLFHTDAVQAAGKIPVDVSVLGVDYLTYSGHKIYGPKGIGALYFAKGAPLDPLIRGGHQEKGLRAGTYNAPAIIAFGEAALIAAERLDEWGTRMRSLRNRLRDGFIAKVPDIRINGHPEQVLPNTLNVSFPGAEGEAILLSMDLEGIDVSTGSACASGDLEPSHVLVATGVGPELAHGSIRFSMGNETTVEEIDYVLEKVPPIIARLRSFSTVIHKE